MEYIDWAELPTPDKSDEYDKAYLQWIKNNHPNLEDGFLRYLHNIARKHWMLICDGYFLHGMNNLNGEGAVEHFFKWNNEQLELETDIAYPNCCRVCFFNDGTITRRYL